MTYIGIVIWESAEPLDFTGPFEVFNNTRKFLATGEKLKVLIVGEKKQIIDAQGLQIMPHHSFESAPKFDVLLFPGGGVNNAIQKTSVVDWLKNRSNETNLLLSVCTGVFILAFADLLKGSIVTTHIGSIEKLREYETEYGYTVQPDHRYHDNGKIITSAGISAGIDMALHVVMRLWGEDIANRVADYMEYHWIKNDTKRKV